MKKVNKECLTVGESLFFIVIGVIVLSMPILSVKLNWHKEEFNPCCGQYGFMCLAYNITYTGYNDLCVYNGNKVYMEYIEKDLQQCIKRPTSYYTIEAKDLIS